MPRDLPPYMLRHPNPEVYDPYSEHDDQTYPQVREDYTKSTNAQIMNHGGTDGNIAAYQYLYGNPALPPGDYTEGLAPIDKGLTEAQSGWARGQRTPDYPGATHDDIGRNLYNKGEAEAGRPIPPYRDMSQYAGTSEESWPIEKYLRGSDHQIVHGGNSQGSNRDFLIHDPTDRNIENYQNLYGSPATEDHRLRMGEVHRIEDRKKENEQILQQLMGLGLSPEDARQTIGQLNVMQSGQEGGRMMPPPDFSQMQAPPGISGQGYAPQMPRQHQQGGMGQQPMRRVPRPPRHYPRK